ncbi:MAG: 50S ribosomal protein L24 [Bacteroidetes bacterium]|nr:50S ribosomal protein L24 [Bacteroidota bacterium]
MRTKLHIRKGDMVTVLAGDSRGMQGKVLNVDTERKMAIVEGINLVSKHTKPNAKSPQGGILKKEAPVHISNLMVIDSTGKPTRTGRKIDPKKNISERYSKNSGEVIK